MGLPSGGGEPVDMGGQATWDFTNQPWFPISGTVKGGDTIRTRCAWENPTDATVELGECTEDDMGYSFPMYYPGIKGLSSWSLPAALSRCAPTK